MKAMHRFFSCFMAVLILASTTSWTVEKHYCMGHIQSMSFFTPADNCGMAADEVISENPTISEPSCCSDEVFTLPAQDELHTTFTSVVVFFTPITLQLGNSSILKGATVSLVKRYTAPPPIPKNIYLVFSTFLI